ncbi:hypothetical protein CYMTET_3399 [Cymbomonas tetramitiformis]|uniref:Uncharacterized protein n=1 Tax=Cymbomonas tetramitiformis TaxID=36881 RepID=A0AAE0H3D4_9CHLO|nr:hypothetical protein CYMTET_3399 [Cymbomonas tetramitiformis]
MAAVVDPNSFIELVVFGAMLTAFFVFLRKDNVLVEKADAWNPRGHLVRSDASFPVADDGSRRAEARRDSASECYKLYYDMDPATLAFQMKG